MPYAAFNHLAQDEFEGALEITSDQYVEGVQALTAGLWVLVEPNGFEIVDAPTPEEPAPHVPTPEEISSDALGQRDYLLGVAALRIAPLQYAVDLDMATPTELSRIREWKKYSVELNRVQDQTGFPSEIEWPVEPV